MGKFSRRRNHTMRSSSSSSAAAAAAASILLISSSGPLSPSLLIPGAQALGSAFSCGASLREARSCTTLCSTTTTDDGGGSSECPSGQKCYAGIECEPSKSMDWILDWQERLERRVVEGGDSHHIPSSSSSSSGASTAAAASAIIRTHPQQQQQQSSFVCGMTYSDVEARCKRATSSSSASSSLPSSSSSSVGEDYHGVHYCPTGSSTECPSSMECYYATVSCSLPSQQQQLGVEQGADLELLPGLPPLVSPSSNILSRLDVDSLTFALSKNNDTSVMAASNANITEEVNEEKEEEEDIQVHWKFGSSSSSWGAFFRESLSSLMASSSSTSSSSSVVSSSHSSLRYSSRHDWN